MAIFIKPLCCWSFFISVITKNHTNLAWNQVLCGSHFTYHQIEIICSLIFCDFTCQGSCQVNVCSLSNKLLILQAEASSTSDSPYIMPLIEFLFIHFYRDISHHLVNCAPYVSYLNSKQIVIHWYSPETRVQVIGR